MLLPHSGGNVKTGVAAPTTGRQAAHTMPRLPPNRPAKPPNPASDVLKPSRPDEPGEAE
jgi:hypothetical protein